MLLPPRFRPTIATSFGKMLSARSRAIPIWSPRSPTRMVRTTGAAVNEADPAAATGPPTPSTVSSIVPVRTPDGAITVRLDGAPTAGTNGSTVTVSTSPVIDSPVRPSTNETWFSASTGEKFRPVRVTIVPGRPDAGAPPMITGAFGPTSGGHGPPTAQVSASAVGSEPHAPNGGGGGLPAVKRKSRRKTASAMLTEPSSFASAAFSHGSDPPVKSPPRIAIGSPMSTPPSRFTSPRSKVNCASAGRGARDTTANETAASERAASRRASGPVRRTTGTREAGDLPWCVPAGPGRTRVGGCDVCTAISFRRARIGSAVDGCPARSTRTSAPRRDDTRTDGSPPTEGGKRTLDSTSGPNGADRGKRTLSSSADEPSEERALHPPRRRGSIGWTEPRRRRAVWNVRAARRMFGITHGDPRVPSEARG